MAVFGTLLQPLRHLAFDDARVDPVATWLSPFLAEFPKKRVAPLLEGA